MAAVTRERHPRGDPRASSRRSRSRAPRTPSRRTRWSELDVDSLDLVELVKALEDKFDITISDDDLKPIESVGDAIALTMRLSEAEEGAPA